jgi:RNA recognition motif-containing protein
VPRAGTKGPFKRTALFPRGFGFVTFVHKSSVDATVQGMHGKQLDSGTLLVIEHKPRRDRPRRL